MADYNVGTTGIVVTADVEKAIAGLSKLKTTIDEVKKSMHGLNIENVKTVHESPKVEKSIRKIDDSMKELPLSTQKAQRGMNGFLKTALKLGAIAFSIRRIAGWFHQSTDQIASFGENVNLFNVAMRHNNQEAIRFATTISQMYGVNLSNTMKYQGQFMNLGQALGINTEMAYKMSEALTLLTYDLASLYNWTDDMAYNRLLAGLVGQTKPLRYAGIDVTQQTIQPILDELGIQKSVIQLTQQEKVMLRMIAILRQSTNAQADYGRTIESLSNQMKIWQHQVTEIKRWLGALWFQIATRIMPILNGLAMAIKEVIKSLAMMLGFDMKDFDFVTGNMDSGFIDLENGAKGAEEAVKKLNGSLRKFDEINNITRSTGGATGFDLGNMLSTQTLQRALNEEMDKYRAKLSDVSMKAHEIRDNIMQWLGFTRHVNEETGEIYYTNERLEKLMRDIGDAIRFAWDMLVGFFKFITSDTPAANAVIHTFVGYFITMKALALVKFFAELGNTMQLFFEKIFIGSTAANVPLGISVIKFAALIIIFALVSWGVTELIKNWDQMSGLQRVLGIIGLATLAMVGLAIAIGAVKSALTMGIAGLAIAGGILAIVAATNTAGFKNGGGDWNANTFAPKNSNVSTGRTSNVGMGSGTTQSGNVSGNPYRVRRYASGGFPSRGEMFIMNEEEPEWIGNLGGRTAVMNKDQVVQSVLSLVDKSTNALSGSRSEQSQVVNLYADDILLGKAVIKSINKTSLATGLTIK